ncbi:MAG: helix-hairpin-helix domain-containing protein [Clostridiales bacterium]|nr:helix-hairpin-helix domain-containing protein [Clostridiales bacterium]
MHQLQRIGLLGITILLLFGFWAGLWYRGQTRGGATVFVAEESSAIPEADFPSHALVGSLHTEFPDQTTTRGSETESANQAVAVHIVGQVEFPGLYYLPEGSRIYDAVMEAAPTDDADLAVINMALCVEDGMQIRIPAAGKPSPWGTDGFVLRSGDSQEHISSGGSASARSDAAPASKGKININTAGAKDLEELPGIGPAYSLRIITYRKQYGDFKSIEDLTKVSGIGPAKMDAIRDLVTCS